MGKISTAFASVLVALVPGVALETDHFRTPRRDAKQANFAAAIATREINLHEVGTLP